MSERNFKKINNRKFVDYVLLSTLLLINISCKPFYKDELQKQELLKAYYHIKNVPNNYYSDPRASMIEERLSKYLPRGKELSDIVIEKKDGRFYIK